MFRKYIYRVVIVSVLVWSLVGFVAHRGEAASCNVLVVMGFHEGFIRSVQAKEGIEEVLGETCELHYVYLNAFEDPQGVATKAQEAYTLYQALQPDGVIASNDDAQVHFVIPYLKDKVETPVMFCDVLAEPAQYGYPASNVSGILTRYLIAETLVFAKQLVPSIETVGVLFANEPSSQAVARQIVQEQETYSATLLEPVGVNTFDDAVTQAGNLQNQSDALLIGPTGSLFFDASGNQIPMSKIYSEISTAFGKPTFSFWKIVVQNGVLAAVAEFGQEQGRVAAEMLIKAMDGTPIADLPITQTQYGERVLNLTTMQSLGIKPTRKLLTGVELVK